MLALVRTPADKICKDVLQLEATFIVLMVPAHFHDVDGNLFNHNVGKIFGLDLDCPKFL